MKKFAHNRFVNKVLAIMTTLVAMVLLGAVLPYPIFSNLTNITEVQSVEINDHREIELRTQVNDTPKILEIDFASIDAILPPDSIFEIVDVQSERSFFVVRTGGLHHLDFEPQTKDDQQIFFEICGQNWSWKKRPVLVKATENAYLPASASCYPHGYGQTGHFCLHFIDSKTDGTQKEDFEHQKNIKIAKAKGRELLKSNKL